MMEMGLVECWSLCTRFCASDGYAKHTCLLLARSQVYMIYQYDDYNFIMLVCCLMDQSSTITHTPNHALSSTVVILGIVKRHNLWSNL